MKTFTPKGLEYRLYLIPESLIENVIFWLRGYEKINSMNLVDGWFVKDKYLNKGYKNEK